MTTDKELADAHRAAAVTSRRLAELGVEPEVKLAENHESTADYLDPQEPPAPTYADGTVAWVSVESGNRWLATREGKGWVLGGCSSAVYQPTKVEPLRVLADDEIAIKHPGFIGPAASEILRVAGFNTSADLLARIREAFAALDAESGEAK